MLPGLPAALPPLRWACPPVPPLPRPHHLALPGPRSPDVASAEPDYLVQADANPSDTKWNTQWNLKKVGAPAAWDTTVGSNITVCVADSGVDYL